MKTWIAGGVLWIGAVAVALAYASSQKVETAPEQPAATPAPVAEAPAPAPAAVAVVEVVDLIPLLDTPKPSPIDSLIVSEDEFGFPDLIDVAGPPVAPMRVYGLDETGKPYEPVAVPVANPPVIPAAVELND